MRQSFRCHSCKLIDAARMSTAPLETAWLREARQRRGKLICDLMRSREVADWRGWIHNLSSNSDGFGVLTIRIAPRTYVRTHNSSLSDIGDNTLIKPGCPV